MVNSDVPYYTLNEQHRMRPELSSLVTPTIYPNLLNHESVFNRPHVRGVNKDLFFLNHNHYETEVRYTVLYFILITIYYKLFIINYLL